MTDVVLIGAGVMSATLGTLLRKLDPTLSIEVYERLDRAAAESSAAWNNAGTGHSAFCELNYTPERPDGSVDVRKAIQICEQFEVSKQFWAALVRDNDVPKPASFIRQIPHMSFVWGQESVDYLKARHRALLGSPLFEGMQLSEDPNEIAGWMPLVMEGRQGDIPVAATRMAMGNDVNFGVLTREMIAGLNAHPNAHVHLSHEVIDFHREKNGLWRVQVHDIATGHRRSVTARFVFIGGGGGTLSLLERTGIPEAKGYGGFPVSGQWLKCVNREVIERHQAKVYGKAEIGAPPMSVPHLDTRHIRGQKELLFGPYAGFTTKFLKRGSFTDLFASLGMDNIVPMMHAGAQNIDLTRYLIGQALLPHGRRMDMLKKYYPGAVADDWEVKVAGLRVQIIKSDGRGGGVLKFGTEVVTSADGSMAALLGASPGASTAAPIMLDVLARCFPRHDQDEAWQATLKRIFPSLGVSLAHEPQVCAAVRRQSLMDLDLL